MTTVRGPRRLFWLALVAVPLAAVGAAAYAYRHLGPAADAPPPVRPPEVPADIADRVHAFCGSSCHAYPPPDIFPRRAWRAEVERGFRFFEQSGMSLRSPPIEAVVR